MPRGANRVGAGAVKKTGQKKVSAKSLKVYKFAAAAADKKLAAAELRPRPRRRRRRLPTTKSLMR